MQKKVPTPRTKWSVLQLQRYIRTQSLETQNVVFSSHVIARMKTRKITSVCVLEVLRKGAISTSIPPEFDSFTGDIKCRMENYVGGRTVGVVVAISDNDPSLILVTIV